MRTKLAEALRTSLRDLQIALEYGVIRNRAAMDKTLADAAALLAEHDAAPISDKPVFAVLYEGGTIEKRQVLAHAAASLADAEAFRIKRSRDFLRTSDPIEVPTDLANAPGFWALIDTIAKARLA